MNSIQLKQIDENNFIDAFNLQLGDGQDAFVSHPIRSLAQAYVYRTQCTPLGIYAGGRMIGYVMVIYDYDEEAYNIWHMMIDRAEQGKGYGKAAFAAVLDYIRAKPFGKSGRILLTCNRENPTALGLYKSFGFCPTGNEVEDEIELGCTLEEK